MQANIARTKFYKESNNLNLPEAKFMRLTNLILDYFIANNYTSYTDIYFSLL